MYNQNQGQGRGQVGFGGLGFIVKGVASGIGLASESIHAHKEKKAAKKLAAEQSHSPEGSREQPSGAPAYDQQGEHYVRPAKQRSHSNEHKGTGGEHELEEGDEEQWDLDDAQDELIAREPVNPKNRPFERDPKKVTQHFIDDYPISQSMQQHGKLNLPVVLPQRRPKDRSRGFIRAYAPELQNAGIDQPMFLDFLETFNTASQASPWLNAVNMAGMALMPLHLATGVSMAATIALYLTVEVMKNMQSRSRYSGFLDQINEGFFQPRGLYCLVLTWNPETDATEVGVNINETIHQNLTPPEGIAKVKHSLRPSMGNTNGVAFTETAPLVFPALDKLEANNSAEAKTMKEKMKNSAGFAGEYFDRRAQAKFAAQAPDSQLVVGPKPTFTSRYADPNNPTNSGDILALLTAGKLSMPNRGGFGGSAGGMGGRGSGGLGAFGMPSGFGMRGNFGGGMGSPLDQRTAMSYGRGMGGGFGRRGMGMGGMNQQQMGYNQQYPNQAYPGQEYPNQMGPNQQYPNQQYNNQGYQQYPNQQIGFGGTQLIANGVKRILRHHVLYLVIVNMPTEEEMASASKFMDEANAGQQQGV